MNPLLAINVSVFLALLLLLVKINRGKWSLSKHILLGMAAGLLFGIVLQCVYGPGNPVLEDSVAWFNIVGNGYVSLLKMIVIPLIFTSVLGAVVRLHSTTSLGTISLLTITTLLFTALIAALVGVFVTDLFNLTAAGLVPDIRENAHLLAIQNDYLVRAVDLSAPQLILSFIPKNPFVDFSGATPASIVGVVIFTTFLGIAALQLLKDDPEQGQKVLCVVETLQTWMMKLVKSVVRHGALRSKGNDGQNCYWFQY